MAATKQKRESQHTPHTPLFSDYQQAYYAFTFPYQHLPSLIHTVLRQVKEGFLFGETEWSQRSSIQMRILDSVCQRTGWLRLLAQETHLPINTRFPVRFARAAFNSLPSPVIWGRAPTWQRSSQTEKRKGEEKKEHRRQERIQWTEQKNLQPYNKQDVTSLLKKGTKKNKGTLNLKL